MKPNSFLDEAHVRDITEKHRIFLLINQCIDTESRMQLRFDQSEQYYRCKIINLDHEKSILYLSSISPIYGQRRLERASKIWLSTEKNGTEINLECKLQRSYNPFSDTKYSVLLPSLIQYRQRRQSHRVHIGLALGIRTVLQYPLNNFLEGQLRDISSDGMRIQFRRVTPTKISQLDSISECLIALPDMTQIHCDFEIRHLYKHHRNKGCDIGGSFIELENQQKRSIEKFIASVERQAMREHR